MSRQLGHQGKIIKDEDLLYEGAEKSRARLRMAAGIALVVLALVLLGVALAPLVVKANMPLLWVAYANENGWTKYIQGVGQNLLSQARIELFPIWISYIALSLTAVSAWLGIHMIRNRYKTKVLGEIFTRAYWLNFYMIKPPKASVSVEFKELKRK